MYLTIPETADLLRVEESFILALVLRGHIRAVHDGEQFLVNKEQFARLDDNRAYGQMDHDYDDEPVLEQVT